MQNAFTKPVQRSAIIHARITGVPTINANYGFDQQQNDLLFTTPILLHKIEVFTATQLAQTPIGNYPVIAANAAPSITFTLVTKKSANEQIIVDEPVYSAIRSLNGGFFFEFETPLYINTQDSYITIRDTTNVVQGTAVPFAFYYNYANEY